MLEKRVVYPEDKINENRVFYPVCENEVVYLEKKCKWEERMRLCTQEKNGIGNAGCVPQVIIGYTCG